MGKPLTLGCSPLVQVGALVWGTVRRVESYGVFVGIDGTRLSGLLHISCISRSHIESVEVGAPDLLKQRIWCKPAQSPCKGSRLACTRRRCKGKDLAL